MLLTGDGTALRMAAHEGLRTTAMTELRLLAEHGLQGYTLETLRPTVVIDYQSDVRLRHRPAKLVADEGLTSQIAVPLVGREGPRGTLTVGNRRRTEFTERDAELLDAFGRWAAVAIETSELYDRLQSLARLEERDRIGMDLHDGVIQSIYAVGLHLEACLDQLDESPARLKPALEKAMDDLNRVIKDIRSYIFDLRPQVSSVSDLPRALRQLLEDVRLNALIAGELEVEGDVGELIDETRALALFHIAQEALNNVVKHSRASRVRVRLAVTGNSVELVVEDDGAGFEVDEGGARDRHGLRNIRDRARSIGADLALESTPGKGTLVRVELPVPRAERVT
jgi:signal transduction histidine kinase